MECGQRYRTSCMLTDQSLYYMSLGAISPCHPLSPFSFTPASPIPFLSLSPPHNIYNRTADRSEVV